jgi:hypothetical protein
MKRNLFIFLKKNSTAASLTRNNTALKTAHRGTDHEINRLHFTTTLPQALFVRFYILGLR